MNIDTSLFDRYSVRYKNGQHVVKAYDAKGTGCTPDAATCNEILRGKRLCGGIGFTKVCRIKTKLSFGPLLFYLAQRIHEFFTGHLHDKTLARNLHAFIVTDESTCLGTKCAHLIQGSNIQGVVEHYFRPLSSAENSSYQVYVPKNLSLRNHVASLAKKTSFVRDSPGKTMDSIQKQSDMLQFSTQKALTCLFRTGREMAPKNQRAEEYTAHVLADVLQGNVQNISDPQGNKLSFFCSSYVTTIFQAALFQQAVEEAGGSASFLHDQNGTPLDRAALAAKIQNAFRNGGSTETEKAIQRIFQQTEFARVDAEYFASYRFVELAKQNSVAQPVIA